MKVVCGMRQVLPQARDFRSQNWQNVLLVRLVRNSGNVDHRLTMGQESKLVPTLIRVCDPQLLWKSRALHTSQLIRFYRIQTVLGAILDRWTPVEVTKRWRRSAEESPRDHIRLMGMSTVSV